MKKWLFEKELNEIKEILIKAYLLTSHSKTITIIYTDNEKVYYYDLTKSDIYEMTTLKNDALSIKQIGKKTIEKIKSKSIEFANANDIENTKNLFPNYSKNFGYIAEFTYRMKVTNETEKEIKSTNNSKSYDIASDTKDNKQLKAIDNGATFTKVDYILKVAKQKNLDNINEIEKAINKLKEIYKK